jgi:hypothetical protein
MIQGKMPVPMTTFDTSFGTQGSFSLVDRVADLEHIDRLALVDANTCCEKVF